MTEPLPSASPAEDGSANERLMVKRALAWTHTSRFLTTASRLSELPVNELPEIAFVGRSNAGKSTAINMLAQQKRLAFASKTPGRTQHINLFEVGPKDAPDAMFVDLPGYGYAAVERSAKLRWQEVMADYLAVRRNLVGMVLLIDSRHGFTDLDRRFVDFVTTRIANGTVSLVTLLTKSDKLSKRLVAAALDDANLVLREIATEASDVSLTAFSAFDPASVGAVAVTLRGLIARQALPRALDDAVSEAPPGSLPAGTEH